MVARWIAAARSRPQRATDSWYIGAAPAMKKPPLRPLAPDATARASSSSTERPASSSCHAHASPPTPPPITHTSAVASSRSAGRAA
jgi:hypothetical protein